MGESKNYGMNTKAIHTQKRIELPTGDVMPPIHHLLLMKIPNLENMNIFMVGAVTQQENCLKEPWPPLKVLIIMRICILLQWHLGWLL